MKGKKGFELTATFLVTLIITIVIFTGSIYFTKRFFSTAEEMRAQIDSQTESEIQALLYQEGALVAMPKFKSQLKEGQNNVYGLGIRNVLDKAKDFYVSVEFTKAFTTDEDTIQDTEPAYINSRWLLYNPGPYTIENNELQMIALLANAGSSIANGESTPRGIYSFNVCVFAVDVGASQPNLECADIPKTAIPERTYDGKVHKMYVEVI